MNFLELINKVNTIDWKNKNERVEVVNNININNDNFNEWVNNIFSDKVDLFDMNKLPFLIDELYQSDEKIKFMLCCMLLESTCDKLKFITNLEKHSLFIAKFETLINTLVAVYERVDNGISNCMSLIILNNDPEYKYFNNDLKYKLIQATIRKLKDIFNYLKTQNINPLVFYDLEVIVDMACYLNDNEINTIINYIDSLGVNGDADVYIIKYKIINNLNIFDEKVEKIISKNDKLIKLYSVMENLNVQNKYLKNVSQEKIAMSDMVRWLMYPTELGNIPDNIELLGEIIVNDYKYFAFKFFKENFRIKEEMIGVSGGYPIDKISSRCTGGTFSNFEIVSDNWKEQAIKLIELISGYWKARLDNN